MRPRVSSTDPNSNSDSDADPDSDSNSDSGSEPGENADDYQYIILDAAFDGTTLTIAEKPGQTCDKVLAQYNKSQEWAGHRRMVQKACAARGRYLLHDGKLVRAP